MRVNRRKILAFGAALSALTPDAWGQIPYRQSGGVVRLIVPRAVGGPTDIVARVIAERAKSQLGTIVVFNMGGAGGSIGTDTAARAEPDGKMLLLAGTSDIILNPIMMDRVAESKSLVPIAVLANTVSGIVVNPAVPAKNLAELVAFVKANPGKLSYATSGTGTVAYLAGELFKQLAGIPDLIAVPYRGVPPLLTDLSAGHISIGVTSLISSVIDLHKEGKIRILAVASQQRMSALPDVPTCAESGYPKLVALLFLALFAPAGTPAPVVQQLSDVVRQITTKQKFRALFADQGLEPVLNSGPDDAAKFVREEYERWEPLVRSLGLKY